MNFQNALAHIGGLVHMVHVFRKNICFLGKKKVLLCGTKFLRVLIFAVFPAMPPKKFPQIKITSNIFSVKIYPRVNIL